MLRKTKTDDEWLAELAERLDTLERSPDDTVRILPLPIVPQPATSWKDRSASSLRS